MTEEENTTLRTKLGSLETEARQTKEANNKLQQMYAERSGQILRDWPTKGYNSRIYSTIIRQWLSTHFVYMQSYAMK